MAHRLHSCACVKLSRLQGLRRPMSDRRRQSLKRPALPEDIAARALESPFPPPPRTGNRPRRGVFSFHSEVQCLDVVSTESRSPAHRADFLAARGTSTKPGSSAPSSTLPCAIAAAAASTAPFHWRSTSRRSITCTRSRTEALTHRATSSPHARHAIGSRVTCCLTSSSVAIPGQARTSSAMRARSTAR